MTSPFTTRDPSLVSTDDLRASLFHDVKEAQHAISREDWATTDRWLSEARFTLAEIRRRAAADIAFPPPPWPPGPENNARRAGWEAFFRGVDSCPFPPQRRDLHDLFMEGWRAASSA